MTLSIIPVNQIFGKYDQQTRMGELSRKNPVKTIQNQVDRVTISPEALKKRAIDAALAAIQNSSQVSSEAKSTSIENVEPVSYADKVIQNALEKSKERKEKEEELSAQSELVKDKFLKKAEEIATTKAAKKKEQEEKEATPF